MDAFYVSALMSGHVIAVLFGHANAELSDHVNAVLSGHASAVLFGHVTAAVDAPTPVNTLRTVLLLTSLLSPWILFYMT